METQKIFRYGCAPILLCGALIMGPTSERLSRQDKSDLARLAPTAVSSDKIDSTQEGKLIFVSGPLSAGPLHDPFSDLTTPGLRLRRSVHIWQWVQHSREITRTNPSNHKSERVGFEYTYTQDWTEKPVDSAKFVHANHDNPPAPNMPEATNFTPTRLQVGAYQVSPAAIDQLGAAADWKPPAEPPRHNGHWDAARGEFFPDRPADGKPALGNLRLTYQVTALPDQASALGQLHGQQLQDFKVPSGSSKPPELKAGPYTLAQFLDNDVQGANMAVWFFRLCDTAAILLAGYFLGLRRGRWLALSLALLILVHVLPGAL